MSSATIFEVTTQVADEDRAKKSVYFSGNQVHERGSVGRELLINGKAEVGRVPLNGGVEVLRGHRDAHVVVGNVKVMQPKLLMPLACNQGRFVSRNSTTTVTRHVIRRIFCLRAGH